MLPSTEDEKLAITEYYLSQSSDASVSFLQKVYAESVIGHRHDVWDVHASDGRWWVITNPTNLYSQDQFPNMDLAVTFHMGLCLRVPPSHHQKIDSQAVHPFAPVLLALTDAGDALGQARDAAGYRTIGVRCRENLLTFVHAAQDASSWTSDPPKRSDFKAWADLICNTVMPGSKNRERRRLVKTALEEAWTFANWLTHSQSATWLDAEAACNAASYALDMVIALVIRHIREIPEQCPDCSSPNLTPEEGLNTESPEIIWERAVCADCGWHGEPTPVGERPQEDLVELITREGEANDECSIMPKPLTGLVQPEK